VQRFSQQRFSQQRFSQGCRQECTGGTNILLGFSLVRDTAEVWRGLWQLCPGGHQHASVPRS
jgi:hypothetical protein